MCESCFEFEIQNFPTRDEFEAFDLILTKKIANTKSIKMQKFVSTALKDIGYQLYECIVCGQLWKLSTPDHLNSGYFMRMKA